MEDFRVIAHEMTIIPAFSKVQRESIKPALAALIDGNGSNEWVAESTQSTWGPM